MRKMPIHELLNRIHWDPGFASGTFALGYFDRVRNQIILVPLREITFPRDNPHTFRLVDASGRIHRVPFHRVREIYKNGGLIWNRPNLHRSR